MFRRPGGKRHGGKARSGQSMVEFALCVPVFLLFIFGIFQIALLYQANSALGQAATDAVHVLAAQSTSGTSDPRYSYAWQVDGPGLSVIRSAMTSLNLNNIVEIDVYNGDQNGNVISSAVAASNYNALLSSASPQTISLKNQYVVQQPSVAGKPTCPVDAFWLGNGLGALPSSGSNWTDAPDIGTPNAPPAAEKGCALPWNGDQYAYFTNQNGRNDQRCSESHIYVKIVYSFRSVFYPLLPAITLTARDQTTLEPRQFIGNQPPPAGQTC